MKKIMCSYGNQPYYKSLTLLENTAREVGKIDNFYKYTQQWLETTDFYLKNKYILDNPRGAGYWLWKPKIILDTFNEIEDGDIVLYSDAALYVIDDLTPLFDIASNTKGIMLFRLPGGHLNKTWTKKDCFVLTGCDSALYHNSNQTNGALSLWVKNESSILFLTEWLKIMRDPRVVTDDPNFCGLNYPGFRAHRHDQSVLSLLSIKYGMKYGIEKFRDPTQYGNTELFNFTNSPYPQLFNHHRQKL